MLRVRDAYLSFTRVHYNTILSAFAQDNRGHEGVQIGRLSYDRHDWNCLDFPLFHALWPSPISASIPS